MVYRRVKTSTQSGAWHRSPDIWNEPDCVWLGGKGLKVLTIAQDMSPYVHLLRYTYGNISHR